MKVLVTGAAGFVGRHVCERLLARGDEVIGLDIDFDRPLSGGVAPLRGSVEDPDAVARAIDGCEAVVHCAAITGLWARRRALFHQVNVEGTRIVLDAVHKAGIEQCVHVSSFVTLISGGRDRPGTPPRLVDEHLELPLGLMLGPYPRSKRAAELLARTHPAQPVIVMPSAPVGPGDHGLTPPSRMLSDIANGRLPALLDCTWNFVDVRYLSAGIVSALEQGMPGRRYLLSGQNMDTGALCELLKSLKLSPPRLRVPHGIALTAARAESGLSALLGSPPKAPLTGVRLAGPALEFSSSRAEAELGFAPGNIATAFAEALTWMRRNGQAPKIAGGRK